MTPLNATPPCPDDGERLGEEITELYAYMAAATYRLLELIREFDEQGNLGIVRNLLLCALAQLQVRHRHERRPREGPRRARAQRVTQDQRGL